MKFQITTAVAALGLMAAPAMAQTPEAQLTTPPPADEQTQSQPAPQAPAQGQAQQPTPEQRQAVKQAVQQYFALYGLSAYAERCSPYPVAERMMLDAQIEVMRQQFARAGADLSDQETTLMQEVSATECGSEDYAAAYDALGQQLSTPVDVLVMSFDQVDASCRNSLLDTDDASFSALVERRSSRYGEALPEQMQTGVQQTSTAISEACANAGEEQLAQMRQALEIQAVQAALNN